VEVAAAALALAEQRNSIGEVNPFWIYGCIFLHLYEFIQMYRKVSTCIVRYSNVPAFFQNFPKVI
jgi:hypothetical protein